jgi:hypothetical protein
MPSYPMADRDIVENRIFSYEEATALLPEIRRMTEDAFRRVEAVTESGPNNETTESKLSEIVSRWAQAVLEKGVQVKGLWLIDFDNGSGYYCWRYPEDGLHYYHSYEEGFQGRMRIQ